MELKLPNLGENVSESTIITLHLEKGKNIQKDDIILELETDKATLEIPSPNCGIVKEVLVKVGDSIKQGHVVAILEENSSEPAKEDPVKEEAEAEAEIPKTEKEPLAETNTEKPTEKNQIPTPASSAKDILVPASPIVRRFAREIGIDIRQVKGTLTRERICIEDVKAYAKKLLQSGKTSISSGFFGCGFFFGRSSL